MAASCQLAMDEDSFYIFPIERSFNYCDWAQLVGQFYHKWCFVILATYLATVFAAKKVMVNREPFKLKAPLIVWNVVHAVFSILGAIATGSELFALLGKEGLDATLTNGDYRLGSAGFYILLFTLSKMADFLDTGFIVLKKKKLTFFHYYHHVSACWYVLYQYTQLVPVSRWCAFTNFVAHSLMYSYYALSAMGIRTPKKMAMAISVLQCSQFYLCLVLLGRAVYLQGDQNNTTAVICFLQYSVYAAMFTNYFVQSYFGRREKTTISQLNHSKQVDSGNMDVKED
ncbi:Elongation of very long chain fatty acids protein 6 [Halotydeus destructor]|nr:Elongation of very long chain fatty acids protein 6 [Halotydeus destructor]